jgi:bifunctional DNase/RNase
MAEMVQVIIDSIRYGLMSQQRVIILREMDAERFLAIWIDNYMAEQITFSLQEVEVARPMSHDLIKNILKNLNARILRVEVVAIRGDVFYGNIIIQTEENKQINIDARPSDALALAVRTSVPIFVSKEVMENAGVEPEEDIIDEKRQEPFSRTPSQSGESETEAAVEDLSLFEQFLDDIEPGDEDEPKEEDKS